VLTNECPPRHPGSRGVPRDAAGTVPTPVNVPGQQMIGDRGLEGDEAMDPNPDYDASDELEYGINWFAWILRGVYPPPAYPPV
jgi:hypothetical protein